MARKIRVYICSCVILSQLLYMLIVYVYYRHNIHQWISITTNQPIKTYIGTPFSSDPLWGTVRKLSRFTCSIPQINNIFMERDLNAIWNGTCFETHMDWNEEKQYFTMKCSSLNHIPVYRDGTYSFTNVTHNLHGWKKYPDGPVSTQHMDVIQTACIDPSTKQSSHNYRVQAIRNETLIQQRLEQQRQYNELVKAKDDQAEYNPVNIHVLVIDACGKDTFQRLFPHSDKFIQSMKQMSQSQKLGTQILEMKNYHVLDINSDPNMYAFATGLIDFKILNASAVYTKQNRPKLLWEYMHEYGYVSSVGEDVAESRTGIFYSGNKNFPLPSYDIHPAFHKVSNLVQVDTSFNFMYKRNVCPCTGDKFMSEIVFDYTRSFAKKYNDVPQFVMTVSDEAHDSIGNQIVTLDRNLKDHLEWYFTSGQLKNTVLVLMSDHGLHYGPFIKQARSQYEHQHPLLTMFVPDRLATKQLTTNTNRLMGLKDLHMTLRDIASFPIKSAPNRKDAVSMLYNEIPENRNCTDMLVNPKYQTYCNHFMDSLDGGV
jgi:hypothetical protein